MPNHVSHKLTFAADKAVTVFGAVCPDGHFDFETLVPSPPNLYRGDLRRTSLSTGCIGRARTGVPSGTPTIRNARSSATRR